MNNRFTCLLIAKVTDLKKSRKIGKSKYIIFLYKESFILPNSLIYKAFYYSVSYSISYLMIHLMSHSNLFINKLFIFFMTYIYNLNLL